MGPMLTHMKASCNNDSQGTIQNLFAGYKAHIDIPWPGGNVPKKNGPQTLSNHESIIVQLIHTQQNLNKQWIINDASKAQVSVSKVVGL